jgi:hypothetical protein
MKSILPYILGVSLIVLTGCGSSLEHVNNTRPGNESENENLQTNSDVSASLPHNSSEQKMELSPFENAKPWNPRFIQTGLASGVMIEFTGMKKGKKLSAKYANLELTRYLPDTTIHSKPKTPLLDKPVRLQTTINDLQQAFFKVSPGKYLARLTNDWGDRSYIRDLEVKEGEYSVITNDVYAPWLRTKQLSDSTEGR